MATTIGDVLRKLIQEGKAQKVYAMEWLEEWRRKNPDRDVFSSDTVESRLSDCLRNRVQGVKFFFANEARRQTTLAVFQPDPETTETLLRLHDAMTTTESQKLVVDVTQGPQSGELLNRMFVQIKARFLTDDTVFPMALVVTDGQYDRLPRSFDNLRDKLTVEKVASSAAAQTLIDELAGQSALVASPRRRLPLERWAALRFTDADICLDPPDAITLFRTNGALPGLPLVTRPLARIEKEIPERLPEKSPVELRQLMFTLARGDGIPDPQRNLWSESRFIQPGVRLCWARELGIPAAASVAEWEAALDKRVAPVPVEVGEASLRRQTWHAHYRGTNPVVVKVGTSVYAINAPEHVREEARADGNIKLIDIQPTRRPILERMLAAAADLTEDDLLDDPFLNELVARHGDDEIDVDALSYAAATLVFANAIRPRAAPTATNLRAALTALLESPRLEAALRVEVSGGRALGENAPFVMTRAQLERISRELPCPARWPPLAPLTVRRGDALVCVVPQSKHAYSRDHGDLSAQSARFCKLSGDPKAWCEEILHTDGQSESNSVVHQISPWRHTPIDVGIQHWEAADREAAFVLAALRTAVKSSDVIPLPGGAAMVGLGGGIFAEVQVREHRGSANDPPEVSLLQRVENPEGNRERWSLASLAGVVPLFTAETRGYGQAITTIGVHLPHRLGLRGRGYRADIVFRASPLFAPSPASVAMAVASASAGAGSLDAKHRNDDD